MIKPDYKFMHVILNQCLRLSGGKAMFSVFLYSFIQFIVMGIAVAPVSSPLGNSIYAVLLSLLLLFVMNVCSEVSLFGLYIIMSRLVEKKFVTIGFLFFGFRRDRKRIFGTGITFTSIYSILAVIAVFIYYIFKDNLSGLVEKLGGAQAIPFAALILIVVGVIITIPFSFVRLVLYNDRNSGVFRAFIKSASLMKGNLLRFVGFVFYSCGFHLIQALVIQMFLMFASSSQSESGSYQLLTTFLSIAAIIAQYKALTRYFLSVTIYYYSLLGVIHPHKSDETQSQEPLQKQELTDERLD